MSTKDKKTEKKPRSPKKRPAQKQSNQADKKGTLSSTDSLYKSLEAAAEPDDTNKIKDLIRKSDVQGLLAGDSSHSAIQYLDVFRGRLFYVLGMLLVFTIAGFFFSDYLLKVIMDPFIKSGHKLHIFTITGGFMIRLKAAFGCSLIIGFPFIVFQLWRFIRPMIVQENRTFVRFNIGLGVFLFYLGIAFVYFLLMPVAVTILLDFISKDMGGVIGADDYLSFTIIFATATGLLFEFPVVVMILTRIGILTPQFLTKNRKYAIVIIWTVSAILTPTPDPINLSIVSFIFMGFYEASVFASKMIYRNRLKKQEQKINNLFK